MFLRKSPILKSIASLPYLIIAVLDMLPTIVFFEVVYLQGSLGQLGNIREIFKMVISIVQG